MNKNYIIIAVIVLAVIVGFIALRNKGTVAPTDSTLGPGGGEGIEPQTAPAGIVIRMTANGFEPKETNVPVGTPVTFSNETNENRWPASGIHPTHQLYPEFDPQRAVAPGESWTFIFDRVGSWKFHDHLYPNLTGVVTVQ